jgi:hypothetical protein
MSYALDSDSLNAVWIDDSITPTIARPETRRWRDKGEPTSDGLVRHMYRDSVERPIYEFELPEGRSKKGTWMSPYAATPRVMVRINHNQDPTKYNVEADNAAYLEDWLTRNPGFMA